MLAADLRLEQQALLRILSEDKAKDHVWEVTEDWAWIKSGDPRADWRTNIDNDVVTNSAQYEAYDRMVRTSDAAELRRPPEGAQWYTDANAAWDTIPAPPGPVKTTHINARWT